MRQANRTRALLELSPAKHPKKKTSDTSSEARKNCAYHARDCPLESPSAGILPPSPRTVAMSLGPHYYHTRTIGLKNGSQMTTRESLTGVYWALDTVFTIFLDDESPLEVVGPLAAKCRSLHASHETPEPFQQVVRRTEAAPESASQRHSYQARYDSTKWNSG
ncbi:hypothetical protein ASPACDRAFT_40948 [Aspergillus aculeatus ATCC 16872]|uniref:Uncharacterized protein n=1 Tax=Aspergillus aculeatus (strain ATCC 16872 / CBS 172.66 / WB 5094) TaxID=690307 RepID=A0A1L9X0W5_ASPA1|nr:uncharacterized protein ASPACDRAFT_40948 [Aspergillus aculeatus ATCC 16872]OJK02130.1 hypothetical protein ASPACDRAFT_40948 [Aspergillus aculeatus ATCC 16872]